MCVSSVPVSLIPQTLFRRFHFWPEWRTYGWSSLTFSLTFFLKSEILRVRHCIPCKEHVNSGWLNCIRCYPDSTDQNMWHSGSMDQTMRPCIPLWAKRLDGYWPCIPLWAKRLDGYWPCITDQRYDGLWSGFSLYIYTLFSLFHPWSRIFVYRLAKSSLKGTGETVPACDVYAVMIHVSDAGFYPFCSLGHVPCKR